MSFWIDREPGASAFNRGNWKEKEHSWKKVAVVKTRNNVLELVVLHIFVGQVIFHLLKLLLSSCLVVNSSCRYIL